MSQGGAEDIVATPGRTSSNASRNLYTMLRQGRSWSGRERNCAFLNLGDGGYANVSAVTGFDVPDDGRGIGVTDLDWDGDPDLWVVNRSGPQVRFFRNQLAPRPFVAFRLQSGRGNRDGIGARIEVTMRGPGGVRTWVRSLHAGSGFLAQSSKWVHFGLGAAGAIERVRVRWPGGADEEFAGVTAGGFYRLEQGSGRARTFAPLVPVGAPPAREDAPPALDGRVLLSAPAPMVRLSAEDLSGKTIPVVELGRGPVLVHLWSARCRTCVTELRELRDHAAAIRGAGLRVLALCVDGVDQERAQVRTAAAALLDRERFPFPAAVIGRDAMERIERLHAQVFDIQRPLPLPTSLLVRADGQWMAVYRGPVGVATVLADVAALALDAAGWRRHAARFPGRWVFEPTVPYLGRMARAFADEGQNADALPYYAAAIADAPMATQWRLELGELYERMGAPEQALETYDGALQADPALATAFTRRARIYRSTGRPADALREFRAALLVEPTHADARIELGRLLIELSRWEEARQVQRETPLTGAPAAAEHAQLGQALLQAGQTAAAVEQFEAALRHAPAPAGVEQALREARARLAQERGK